MTGPIVFDDVEYEINIKDHDDKVTIYVLINNEDVGFTIKNNHNAKKTLRKKQVEPFIMFELKKELFKHVYGKTINEMIEYISFMTYNEPLSELVKNDQLVKSFLNNFHQFSEKDFEK